MMSTSRNLQRWLSETLDGFAVDLLPTLSGLCALVLFLLLTRIYSYQSVASPPFDVESLSWRDKSPTTPADKDSSDPEPDKVKKALIPSTPAQFQLDEFSARTVWLCSDFLMLAAGLVLLWQASGVLKREIGVHFWKWLLVAVIPGAGFWLFNLIAKLTRKDLHIIDAVESRAKTLLTLGPSTTLDDAENLFVLTVTFIFSFAIGSLCAKNDIQHLTISQVASRARDSVALLNICAVFLVLGVFHLWTQWNWPITFLTSPKDRAFMRLIANSIALSVGSLFTVVLGAIYFTAHARIRRIAHRIADQALAQHHLPSSESLIRNTLETNGFAYSSFFDIPSIAKVLSPLIAAGPVAQLVEWVYAY